MIPRTVLIGLALVVLAVSLGVIVANLGWGVLLTGTAHESEERSLLMTVLYPSHALRELPHLVVLALIWAGTLAPARRTRDAGRQAAIIALGALAAGTLLFLWAWGETGPLEAWVDLSQQRGAPDLLSPGVHYRLHAVSDPILALLLVGAAGLHPRAGRSPLAILGIVLFLAMTALWLDGEALGPRFLGHGVREVVTHSIVTLPLLLALAHHPAAALDFRLLFRRRWPAICLGLAAVLTLVAAVAAGPADVLEHSSAPERSLILNLAVHNFEHLLDLLFLLLVTALATRSITDSSA